ncbi:MAG: hypothetical protein LBC18_15545 [Opitutaceae bacterium]|nr:hypothetical protein [Opitutaceae bacterium]
MHPRILFGPADLPDLRRRLKETNIGRALCQTLQTRLDDTIRNTKVWWGAQLYEQLAAGDAAGAGALVAQKGAPPGIGHYQPYFYAIVMEAFDALIADDATRGRKAATAITTYASMIRPGIERAFSQPMHDDVWRARTSGPVTGTIVSDQGMRDGVGGHLLGYAYDFAWPCMTDAQRDIVRATIAEATAGKLWMGARLPHHFRNWNWIACGLQQPLLALAIEGESGYDPRVYKLGVEIARDYLTHGISPSGMSTEAVGYTQFGFVWGNPFLAAAARRGDNLLCHSHFRAMIDWYIHSMEPSREHWTSHGDGGDSGPSLETLSFWRHHFPDDPKIELVWRELMHATKNKALQGKFHIIEPLAWAAADPNLKEPAKLNAADCAAAAEKLNLPTTLFDPARSSLIARNNWAPDATLVQFECRTDSVGASHEHADRGNFTLAALGRSWASDYFRSVETRHHNNILIDGLGQGYWPGPGKWLGLDDDGRVLMAACDSADAYSYFWPKQIVSENPDTFERFKYARWDSYRDEARAFQRNHAGLIPEKETRPRPVLFWQGFQKSDPRLWDEDAWPVRYPHNPVRRAIRTLVFARAPQPYVLIIDDIQKDGRERLYEWLMQTGPNTAVASLKTNDIILCDATVRRDPATGLPKPAKGDRQLLVRVLDMRDPAEARRHASRPSFRLEDYERKDTLSPETIKGSLSGSRSFGLDKRLVIASRSVAPDFKILLFPHRAGGPLPATGWNDDKTRLTIAIDGKTDTYDLKRTPEGRTLITLQK